MKRRAKIMASLLIGNLCKEAEEYRDIK